MKKPSKYVKPLWTEFKQEPVPELTEEQLRQRAIASNMTIEEARAGIQPVHEFWVNNRYQVLVRNIRDRENMFGPMKHLSIRRRDNTAVHDWRDLQRIKNEIVGAECEAIEIYPAESRLVDTSNQYHLWVFTDPEYRLPLGYMGRMVVSGARAGTSQRPR